MRPIIFIRYNFQTFICNNVLFVAMCVYEYIHFTVWHLTGNIKYEVAADYAKLTLDDVGDSNKNTIKLGQP